MFIDSTLPVANGTATRSRCSYWYSFLNLDDDTPAWTTYDVPSNGDASRAVAQMPNVRVTAISFSSSLTAPVTGGFPSQRASYAKNVSFDDVIM